MASLIISVVSLIVSSILAIFQLKYHRKQDKLNVLLTEKENREIENLGKADIFVEFIQTGRQELIRVSNIGNYLANEILLTFPNGNSWSVFIDTLPSSLQPSQSADLIVARTLSAESTQIFLFSWTDKTGKHEKSFELS